MKYRNELNDFEETKKNKLHILLERLIEEANSLFTFLAYSEDFRKL